MKINDWLSSSIKTLELQDVANPRLDCLVLLEYVLKKDRSLVLAHLDDRLTNNQTIQLKSLLDLRKDRIPLAYILNNKEFYNKNFYVDRNVLIPRPASEDIIELLKTIQLKDGDKVIDVGTGSGIIAVTISRLFPFLTIDAVDISEPAIKIARKNILEHGAKVNLYKSDLLIKAKGLYKVVIANLPYVSNTKKVSKEINYEPKIALFAENQGLKLIYKLLEQTNGNIINEGGYLILEADIEQHNQIIQKAKDHSLTHIKTKNLILLFKYLSE